MVAIKNVLIAGLAIGAVNANMQQPSTFSTVVATTPAAQATPTASPGAVPAPPSAPDSPNNDAEDKKKQLFMDLFTAPTAIKRFQRLLTAKGQSLLSGDALRSIIVFDFNNPKPAKGAKGGATAAANIDSFPILTGLGISTTLGFLNACGINTPHVHPRATEFLTVVDGTVDFGYILENGLVAPDQPAEVAGKLGKFMGTVFPMGSIHYQFNPECKPATFVAALNSEDPGTNQATNFFNLNAGVINATLGFPKTIDGKNIEQFRKAIPANIAQDIDNCLAKCKDYKPTYY